MHNISKFDAINGFVKIIFPVQLDEDGYPGVSSEGIWARKLNDGSYEVDSIPFYVNDLSVGDIIAAADAEGRLMFANIIHKSTNNTLRVFLLDSLPEYTSQLKTKLRNLGAEIESFDERYFSVNLPQGISLSKIEELLSSEVSSKKLEYEVSSKR